nr:hypothetical protein [Tanacetum cinerariifolium]
MSTPTFAKTHNLIAYLEKPKSVKYALTVSLTIHTLCIKQFWTSVKVNDEVRIQALVDGKRVNIKESSIRRIRRLDDAESTSCLTNTEIFKDLARMCLVKNIEAGVPFFMFPRFIQLIINHQVGDMTHYKDIFVKRVDINVEINLEKAQAKAYNMDLDHQEKVLSMLDVNDEEPVDVEEVL